MVEKCFEYGKHFYPELNPLDRGIDEEEQAFEESKPEIIHKRGVNSEIHLQNKHLDQLRLERLFAQKGSIRLLHFLA